MLSIQLVFSALRESKVQNQGMVLVTPIYRLFPHQLRQSRQTPSDVSSGQRDLDSLLLRVSSQAIPG